MVNTLILEKFQSENEIRIDVSSKLIQNRIIFVDDLINDKNAAGIVATLLLLDSESQDKITIFINSEGGDIRNVFMIYDAMKLISSPIETFCIGTAMREATLLLAAGSPGMRLIAKNADTAISQIVYNGIYLSDLTDTKIAHQKWNRDNEAFLKELSKRTNKPLKQIKIDTERQLFMNAQKTVEYGLADRVA